MSATTTRSALALHFVLSSAALGAASCSSAAGDEKPSQSARAGVEARRAGSGGRAARELAQQVEDIEAVPSFDHEAVGGKQARGVATCPQLTLSITGPEEIELDAIVAFEGSAMSEPTGELDYVWAASAGMLSRRNGSSTHYTCTEVGVQAIVLTVLSSPDCHNAIAQSIRCLGAPLE